MKKPHDSIPDYKHLETGRTADNDVIQEQTVFIRYTNHRSETSTRLIMPLGSVKFTSNEWHPKPQWILNAFDLSKNAQRTFAMKDIHEWIPVEKA